MSRIADELRETAMDVRDGKIPSRQTPTWDMLDHLSDRMKEASDADGAR